MRTIFPLRFWLRIALSIPAVADSFEAKMPSAVSPTRPNSGPAAACAESTVAPAYTLSDTTSTVGLPSAFCFSTTDLTSSSKPFSRCSVLSEPGAYLNSTIFGAALPCFASVSRRCFAAILPPL